ncbi:MAG: valine--tRNA ligase [Thermoplasmatales archaeon]|nr:valine--tRNA ligase [Thermoplasmatales archaeon]
MAQYDPASIEGRWQRMWKEDGVYRFDPASDKPVYSIDNPPRYTSGSLHLGHATGYTLIDFAARYKRMTGHNVFFPLCFDVNGTPIEVRVEKKHGITKLDLPRSEYRELCTEYADGFIDEMIHHFEILGESMDPSIYYRTDAPYYRRITQISFVKLFRMGLVYKGNFPVNWCPRCMTALADAEVEYRDNVTKLNFIKFGGPGGGAVIATTRPELLCTCQAVAVHPDDVSKKEILAAGKLTTPVFGKEVPVIADEGVDPAFGTGNVMICTIGDKDDLEWVMKHKFPMEKGIDEFGRMTELAGKYAGMPVADARAAIIEDMRESGELLEQRDSPQNVSVCWRCHAPVEYLQVPQWFLKTVDLKDRVMARADEINWYPQFMRTRLDDWVNSLEWDWVLSRQRIFATPVPVWECACGHAVPATEEMCYCDPTEDAPPVPECPECGGELVGSTDVFDTWMDSSGSALYNTFWERDPAMHEKLFPMSMRPQSHDIIRTWAFYSILRSEQLKESRPWDDIMIHGFIMAPDGTPMHTSIGNVIDPIPIIEEYGADALRYYAASCSLGIDHAFREKDVVRGRRLCNKIFNLGKFASRFLKSKPGKPKSLRTLDKWILTKFTRMLREATAQFDVYHFDKAMREAEDFLWHEFADHYVEMVKARDDDAARYTVYTVLLGLLKVMAPFLPHVTEDVYQEHFAAHEGARSLHLTDWPEPVMDDPGAVEAGDLLRDVIAAVRGWKSDNKIPLNAPLALVELIGGPVADLAGSEVDVSETVKAAEVVFAETADISEEIVAMKPVHAKLGPEFKGDAKAIAEAVGGMDPAEAAAAFSEGGVKVDVGGREIDVGPGYFEPERKLMLGGRAVDTIQMGDLLIAIEK